MDNGLNHTKLLKLLVVEDNDFDFELVKRELGSLDFYLEIKRAVTSEEYISLLDQFNPDLILSDFSLPSFSGLEALKIAKESYPLIPFIFVSGTIGEELAVETLKQGANDYVLKDNLEKLEPAINRALNEAIEKKQRRQAEEKLQIKIDELKTLVYRVSHDFNGPICSIKGVLNLLHQSMTNPPEELVKYYEMIGQITKKMEGTVLNLNSFHFAYSSETQTEIIKVEELIKELKESILKIEGANEVDLQFHSSGLEFFHCEYNLIYSVLYNLIHNAITFADKNKPIRKVICTTDISEDKIIIKVDDNGVGIPSYIKNRVFAMFYRASTLSRGAGLGLYVTKTIIEKLNGTIYLESQEDIGTKINVSIPSAPINS